MSDAESNKPVRSWVRLMTLAIGIVAFGIAHTQSPLFYSNQHQYFLHGLASGGYGHLDCDWLANTLDPTPAFSELLEFTYCYLHLNFVFLVYFVLMGVYFASLLAIASFLIPPGPLQFRSLIAVGAIIIVIHSGVVRLASVRIFGVDYPWYLQSGVAGQYVLGPGLQPSAFGVFLVASIAAFAHGRPWLALAFSSAACLVHATYLLPAAMLTITYMLMIWREGKFREGLHLGIVSLLFVSPLVVYSYWAFAPTSPEKLQEAQRILAEIRIPHHASISRWFDLVAKIQVGLIFLAIVLVNRSRLFILLTIPALLGLGLSWVQWETHSLLFSLLFPWRVSAVLMPIATTILATRLIGMLPQVNRALYGWFVLILIPVAGGIVIQVEHLAYQTNEKELPALDFVRDRKDANDRYLVPVPIWPVRGVPRGSASATFTPAPGSKDTQFIAVDLQRFRLYTGCPIYVDFKSIPYKDVDVLEWFRRVNQCQKWYAADDWDNGKLREELTKEGITHIMTTANKEIAGDGYELVYSDDYYRIYRLVVGR